jgi:imidazoleglycerol phosphate synthase cyclase subunit
MSYRRLIPVILIKNGQIVRSQSFRIHQIIGNPIHTIRRLGNWNVDELVLLDISTRDYHDMRREDLHIKYTATNTIGLLKMISDVCFMPLTFGGRIRDVNDISERLIAGADKVAINSEGVRHPQFIEESAGQFGSQCIVISIDAWRHEDGRYEVFIDGGKTPTGMTPSEWALQAVKLGAGEILLNSINKDGAGNGYDLELINSVVDVVGVPVIGCGGVGRYDHFVEGLKETAVDAVAAANIFNYYELSYPLAKKECIDAGISVRPIKLDSPWFPREPVYDLKLEQQKYEARMLRAKDRSGSATLKAEFDPVKWCTKCVYPSINAAPMEFDEEGVCMGCRMAAKKVHVSETEWDARKEILVSILEKNRSIDGSRHDCIIAVSGGKDSYFQTHFIKNVLGFNPLLITYYGNNFSEVGQRNLMRMKEVFGVDHIIYQPSVTLLKKLNRLGFEIMGDMNWHNHIGICTVPMKLATQLGIPVVIWGEHGYGDLAGQFSLNDFVEWTYRTRIEHYCRGFEWNYMIGRMGIANTDMSAFQYPKDSDIYKLGLRGLHLSNYVKWEANEHGPMVQKEYGFEVSGEKFDRTYRTMSNLDDIHENGVHDYMKWIKLGYGRGTDHATKDVRAGLITRAEAVHLVNKYDHVKPSDLARWLEYVGMSEEEFDAIADTFRDPRVWRRENGKWMKNELSS